MAEAPPPGFKEIPAPPGFKEVAGAAPVGEARVKHAPVGESALEILGGALNDTFGTGNARPYGERLGRAVFQPKNLGESALREAIMAPVSAVTMPGRIAASAATGPITALASGKSLGDAGWAGALDAAVAGLTEGVGAGVGKVASRFGAPARAYQYATEAPGKALEYLKARLPAGKWLSVPSLGPGKMTVEEAVGKLAKAERRTYEVARAEIAHEMSRLDAQRLTGPKPLAGQVFKHETAPERFAPSRFSKVAEGVAQAAKSPVTRGTADVAATTPVDEAGLPQGALPALAATDHLGAIVRAAKHAFMP